MQEMKLFYFDNIYLSPYCPLAQNSSNLDVDVDVYIQTTHDWYNEIFMRPIVCECQQLRDLFCSFDTELLTRRSGVEHLSINGFDCKIVFTKSCCTQVWVRNRINDNRNGTVYVDALRLTICLHANMSGQFIVARPSTCFCNTQACIKM